MSCTSLKRTALALEDLEPALWGTLTPCLLDLVFLRLPVAQMSQLRLLSKHWKAAIDSVESDFNLLLEDKVYPNLFGFIGLKLQRPVPCVWMFDVNQDRWCGRKIDRSVRGKITMGAADGGLVCFVSNTTKDPLTIVVMNPLTGKKVELPRLLCIHDVLPTIQPSMLHLKMNRKNNHYLVLFVGYIQSDNDRGLLAQVYDSRTEEWSIVGSREKSWGYMSGCAYAWSNDSDSDDGGGTQNGDCYDRECRGPCLYDFAQGQLRHYNVDCESTFSYLMLRDRFFILRIEECEDPSNLIQEDPKSKYIISEYHHRQNADTWVEQGTHGCEPFDGYSEDDHYFCLLACNGYVMVMARKFEPIDESLHLWLYNLSTYNWHVLPVIPGFDPFIRNEDVLMCELRWSATP